LALVKRKRSLVLNEAAGHYILLVANTPEDVPVSWISAGQVDMFNRMLCGVLVVALKPPLLDGFLRRLLPGDLLLLVKATKPQRCNGCLQLLLLGGRTKVLPVIVVGCLLTHLVVLCLLNFALLARSAKRRKLLNLMRGNKRKSRFIGYVAFVS